MSRPMTVIAMQSCLSLALFLLPLHGWTMQSEPDDKESGASEIVVNLDDDTQQNSQPEELEPIDFNPKRPSILGMTVVEGSDGKPVVVDVGASSPAWDAGIRKGDVIVSLHGVEASGFAEWTEDVRKVVSDTVANQVLPTQVLRKGSPLDLQIRVAEEKGRRIPRSRAPSIADASNPLPPLGSELPPQPGAVPFPPASGGVGVGGFGVMEDGRFGDDAPIRAAARLSRTNTLSGTAPSPIPRQSRNPAEVAPVDRGVAPGNFPGADAAAATANPDEQSSGSAGQVGIAEFVDNSGGVLAMVTVSALPVGNYRVGIGEFNGAEQGGFVAPGRAPAVNGDQPRRNLTPLQSQPGQAPQPVTPSPGLQTPQLPGQQPNGDLRQDARPTAPQSAPSSASGETDGAAQTTAVPYTVLAQVSPSANDARPAVSPQKPNAAGTPPATAGNPSGRNVDPSRAIPVPNQPLPSQPPQPGNGTPANGLDSPGQFGIELGVITVGPNGTGQLQQHIEGLRVTNLIGQSVLVVQASNPITRGNAALPQARTSSPGETRLERSTGIHGQSARTPGDAATAPGINPNGSIGVIASGVIQIASSQLPAADGAGAASGQPNTPPSFGSSATQQVPPTTPATPPAANQPQ